MDQRLSGIWQDTLNLLQNEVTELAFNTWFKSISPVSIDDSTLILGVPDNFIKGMVESKYMPLIRNAVKQAANIEYDIRMTIPSEEKFTASSGAPASASSAQKVGSSSGGRRFGDDTKFYLNEKYTFETFVVGNNNRLAHAASVAVAESPAESYNPLFIYGGVGLGKTHLMHAIAHYSIEHNPSLKILYVSSEKFTNELVSAIKTNTNEDFRRKYRSMDILLIDDVQFIGGKVGIQEEFFHTFNSLYESKKQIILSSDKSPKEISTLEERLRSRFEWGLQADIQPPDFETRVAILSKRAEMERLNIPDDVLVLIAEKFVSNIRELEGAIKKIMAYSGLTKREITSELAAEALKDMLSPGSSSIVSSTIVIDMVARHFDLRPEEFRAKNRSRDISYPRQIAMYLCRELVDLSLPKIGDEFERDHTTVLHAINKIKGDMSTHPEMKSTVSRIKKMILGK